jgi:dienelactone hydrolase
MAIRTRSVDYQHDGTILEGLLAWDDSLPGPRPGVLVSHAFRGREDFECGKAEKLAELGYVGFALDLYGKGVKAETREQAFELMNGFTADRPRLQDRLAACVVACAAQPEVDEQRLAAIGFCFGGLCVLDMVRSGLPLTGVASFHGILGAPGNTADNAIASRILVEHGWDDPMATPEQVLAFAEEMKAAGADWQLHAHGGTVHSFTNPAANDADFGTVYNAAADRRSWQSLALFLEELFPGQAEG